jgi:hypothetical protein
LSRPPQVRRKNCFESLSEDPSLRPPGAMPVEFLLLGFPVMDLAGMAIPEDEPE